MGPINNKFQGNGGFINKVFKDKSGASFNPYFAAAKGFDIFRNNQIYNKNRSIQNIDKVGTTGVGTGLNTLGNAAISSGNPIAMAAGFAGKALGGAIDVFSHNPEFEDIDNTYSSERRNVYDLGGERDQINDLDPSKTFWDSQKQMGVLAGSPIGLLGGFLAKGKTKKAKEELNNQFDEAQGRYNKANLNYFNSQAGDMSYNQRRDDRMSKDLFGINKNFYEY